jgi:hypothetical protein
MRGVAGCREGLDDLKVDRVDFHSEDLDLRACHL